VGEGDLSGNKSEENDGTEANGETDARDSAGGKPPASWTFAGFMTFMLFGPLWVLRNRGSISS
jgi:hypothetical protein